MKKTLKVLLVAMMVMGAAVYGFAATSGVGHVYVKITQDALSLNIYSDSVNFGAVPTNTAAISAGADSRIGLTNNGATTIDLQLQLTACNTSWTSGLTPADNGTDKYVMSGIWTLYDSTPLEADFAANDVILSASAQTSSATQFAKDSEADETVKGYNVPFNQDRNLKIRVLTPTAFTNQSGFETRIDLTITAVAH
ncbi:MAG: hypothetical protein ABII64_10355 [Elusimicrobiota bacterium]